MVAILKILSGFLELKLGNWIAVISFWSFWVVTKGFANKVAK